VFVESLVRYQVDTKEYASLTLGLVLTKLILHLNVNSHVRKILKSVLMELQKWIEILLRKIVLFMTVS
jgi:hypothetical protein